ncbi:MAG: diguanylate cyclase [Anaerohalosphaeraceae bacterium]|nr:diguanylate cyclase [Anaerohalosphaeraceae bacterium]
MKENRTGKVLVVDDNQTNLILVQAHLKNMGLEAILADNALDGINAAIKHQPNVILLDVMMPSIDGFETCRRLKSDIRTASIPVIFVTAKDQSEDKVSGLKLGAIDYIAKPFNKGELQARISIVLEMTKLQKKLLLLANTDELTGLSNRRHFFEILEREMLQAKIKGNSIAVMMFDLDHFKMVNDSYGHLCGDKILQQVGKILNENIYPLDIAARYGGEEFIVIMPGMPNEVAETRAEKLRDAIDSFDWMAEEHPITITCSVGFSVFDGNNSTDPYELIKRADDALYAAKRKGRNCIVSWRKIKPEENIAEIQDQSFKDLQEKIASLANRLKGQTIGTMRAFAKAIAEKDQTMAQHAENVKMYSLKIAEKMKVSPDFLSQLETAAVLHDLGKIVISENIINKTTALTDKEIKMIHRHPVISAEILEPVGIFKKELLFIRHHHENYDGTGYPNGLVGKSIPIGSRIIAVADAFDAMTSSRWSNSKRPIENVLDEITTLAGSQFDPEVAEAFKEVLAENREFWPLSQKKLQECHV